MNREMDENINDAWNIVMLLTVKISENHGCLLISRFLYERGS
jgi:hypothetical protein